MGLSCFYFARIVEDYDRQQRRCQRDPSLGTAPCRPDRVDAKDGIVDRDLFECRDRGVVWHGKVAPTARRDLTPGLEYQRTLRHWHLHQDNQLRPTTLQERRTA